MCNLLMVQPVLGPPGPPPALKPAHSVIRKIVDFICTSLFVTDSQNNRRETAMRWGAGDSKKKKYFVLLLISSLPPSHIVFRHLFLFWLCSPLFTAGFPVLALCFGRGRGNRNKGKGGGQTILAQPNPPPSQLHLSPLTNKGTNPSDSLRRAEAGRPLGVRLLTCCKRTTVLAP